MPFFEYDGYKFFYFETEEVLEHHYQRRKNWEDDMTPTIIPYITLTSSIHKRVIGLYNIAMKNYFSQDMDINDPICSTYVMGYILKVGHVSEDEYFNFLVFWTDSISSTKRVSPNSPNSLSPKDELTFTEYCYGQLTFTTKHGEEEMKDEDKYEKDSIKYLTNIYNYYLSPNPEGSKHKKRFTYVKDFDCNAWIEKNSNGMIHLHCFYRRKKEYLYPGTKWLKQSKIINTFIQVKNAKTDTHIRHQFNYAYDDATNVILKEFPKQIKELI